MADISRPWQRSDKGTIVSGLCGGEISMVEHGAMIGAMTEAGHDPRNYRRFRRTMVLGFRVGIWHDRALGFVEQAAKIVSKDCQQRTYLGECRANLASPSAQEAIPVTTHDHQFQNQHRSIGSGNQWILLSRRFPDRHSDSSWLAN